MNLPRGEAQYRNAPGTGRCAFPRVPSVLPIAAWPTASRLAPPHRAVLPLALRDSHVRLVSPVALGRPEAPARTLADPPSQPRRSSKAKIMMLGGDERLLGEPEKARQKLFPATHRENGRASERWLGPHSAYRRLACLSASQIGPFHILRRSVLTHVLPFFRNKMRK